MGKEGVFDWGTYTTLSYYLLVGARDL
jgi:hypothetical protein